VDVFDQDLHPGISLFVALRTKDMAGLAGTAFTSLDNQERVTVGLVV
jgi:hypothetical protein